MYQCVSFVGLMFAALATANGADDFRLSVHKWTLLGAVTSILDIFHIIYIVFTNKSLKQKQKYVNFIYFYLPLNINNN